MSFQKTELEREKKRTFTAYLFVFQTKQEHAVTT